MTQKAQPVLPLIAGVPKGKILMQILRVDMEHNCCCRAERKLWCLTQKKGADKGEAKTRSFASSLLIGENVFPPLLKGCDIGDPL